MLSTGRKRGGGEGIGEGRPSSAALGNINSVVVQRDAKEMYQKSLIHEQSCCFEC